MIDRKTEHVGLIKNCDLRLEAPYYLVNGRREFKRVKIALRDVPCIFWTNESGENGDHLAPLKRCGQGFTCLASDCIFVNNNQTGV